MNFARTRAEGLVCSVGMYPIHFEISSPFAEEILPRMEGYAYLLGVDISSVQYVLPCLRRFFCNSNRGMSQETEVFLDFGKDEDLVLLDFGI